MFKIALCIATEHDWRLVLLAAVVCAASTLATFFLYSRIPAAPAGRRWIWLGMTGLVAGSGIWTTHFVAMLAYRTGLPTGYSAFWTLASLAVAAASTAVGFDVGSSSKRLANTLAGGLIVGLGITAMHYVGMAGYRTTGVLQWNYGYVAASMATGALFSAAALWIAGSGRRGQLALAGGLMTLGIVGMHFTGMTAVTVVADSAMPPPTDLLSDGALITLAVAVTAMIIVTCLIGVALEAAGRAGNLRRLREALDAMPQGVAFFDADDRLVAWNACYATFGPAIELSVGMRRSDLLQACIDHGVFPDAIGRETEWLAQRDATRWSDATQRTAAGLWLQFTNRRTPDGGVVSVVVDITAMKNAKAAMAEARDEAVELAKRAEFAEDVAHLGRWRLDLSTMEITGSAQLRPIFGLPADAPLTLQSIMALTHPDDVEQRHQRLMDQIATGEVIENSVTRIIRPDGELRYLAGDSGVEREADGKVIAVVGILVDVTNHKLAEAEMAATRDAALEQARRAELAESIAHLGHWRLDLATDEVTWSPQMYRIYDLPDDTPLDLKVLLAMTHPDDAKAGAKRMKHQRESGASYENTITRIIRPDGTVRYLAGNTTGERNAKGDLVALIGTIVDVTEQRELESQLRHAKAEAQAAALVKSEFLANMSHELRTPLTSIIGFTNLAIAQAELSPLTRNYVGRVQDASRALLATVNDVLDFSKLEAGQASILPQPTDLTALARSSLDLFTPQAAAKDLTLTMTGETEGLVLSLDPDRVRQILLNLVSNAVKFTAVGGVTLNTAYDRDAQSLLVEVSDTGAGIPPSKIGALFKRFSQVDGSLTRSGGTGLGLAICKGLAEAMGGEIGVDSRPAGGSRFWFRIPAPEATMAAAAPGASHDQLSFSGARVLVADDHPANRELARLFLEGAGADVTEAEDGVEAAALAASLPFDAILMDMRMPRLNGPGALRRIRAAAGPNDATPILAFTADGDEDNERELMALGFQGVVRKPVSPTVLIAAVARVTAFAEPVFAEETAHGH